MNSDADVAAMKRLADGDDLALNEIMDRWQSRVTSFLLRLTGSETVAVDLAEETFVGVYRNRMRYRPRSAFSTWLFGIAANLARHHARWLRRHPTVSFDEPEGQTREQLASDDATPAEVVEEAERGNAVREAVASLPPDLREAVVLFEYEDLSQKEIAAVSGCSAKAVENRLFRARALLREKLSRWLTPA